jgi:hypothetical protein
MQEYRITEIKCNTYIFSSKSVFEILILRSRNSLVRKAIEYGVDNRGSIPGRVISSRNFFQMASFCHPLSCPLGIVGCFRGRTVRLYLHASPWHGTVLSTMKTYPNTFTGFRNKMSHVCTWINNPDKLHYTYIIRFFLDICCVYEKFNRSAFM